MSLLVCSSVRLFMEAPAVPNEKNREKPGQKNKLANKDYARELRKLQTRLVGMQEWVRANGAKLVIVFEGRDAAGKGGVIHRLMERVSPRVFRHVALPAPTEREKSQLYAQRYIKECRRPAKSQFSIAAGTTVLS